MAPPGPNGKPFAGDAQDPRAREEEHRHDRRRQELVADTCGELEETLEQLRTRYELYFVGVERREPSREREEMRRAIGRIKGETGLNTGLRFRIDTLHARFLSYERMWTRTARQKEDGTYRRDLQRLRRHPGKSEPAKPEKKKDARRAPTRESDAAIPGEGAEAVPTAPVASAGEVARPAATPTVPTPAQTAPPRPAPRSAGGLSADQMQALYTAYVEAKKRCHEDVSRITYEALASTVARQVPELIQRYKAKSVEFRVLIKDGKALLKAVPRT